MGNQGYQSFSSITSGAGFMKKSMAMFSFINKDVVY
jgi:hypothetical protein